MNNRLARPFFAALLVGATLTGTAYADPVKDVGEFSSFFGFTPIPGGSITGDAKTKRDAFAANLLNQSTYGFEGTNVGFPFTSFTATGTYGEKTFDLDPDDRLLANNNPAAGRFATDGQAWAEMRSSTMTWDFSANPLHALGFFMSDLGDFETDIVFTLYAVDGTQKVFNISGELNGQAPSGGLAFFGFTDSTGASYNRLMVSADLRNDAFGIDGVVTGAVRGADPNPVPLPGTLALAAAALGLMAMRRRA
ncbi:MAG: hypothetical protein LW768_17105 [Rubrivivax sp.]|jgi:hypothetical protein|nr:hypothetical protein [Rubrivivax sp.]